VHLAISALFAEDLRLPPGGRLLRALVGVRDLDGLALRASERARERERDCGERGGEEVKRERSER
jgi:hypothetical protein